MKRALITGITGQDGYYLSHLLLEKGYCVHGIVRRTSSMSRNRIDLLREERPDIADRLILHYGDVTDAAGTISRILEVEPDEIYNLAAQSHVRISFDKPLYTQHVNADGTLHVLEGARQLTRSKPVRLYQAGTSEMFGGLPGTAPQSETTPFHPRSPYACSKVCAHHFTVQYREAYGLFACNGILFNHESPHRGENFVTRKITLAAARIEEGLQQELRLGNLASRRDWGFAGDYVEAMWKMLQQPDADDYVIATGKTHSVEELLNAAFAAIGRDWRDHIVLDERYLRPTEVDELRGDASKATKNLGWHAGTSFEDLVGLMVEHDRKLVRRVKLNSANAGGNA